MHKHSTEHLLKNYEKIEQVSSLVKKLMAPNPSPFTLYGTGTFIIGREQICIIDPGPSIDSHINNLLNSIANFLFILKLQEIIPPKALKGSQFNAAL